VRTKKEKTLGPASMPKHEVPQKLANYIEEYTASDQARQLDRHVH
jgi:hypothetical protein